MRSRAIWIVLLAVGVANACGSTLGGSANGGTGGSGGAGVVPGAAMLGQACVQDSDCGNAYLACVPVDVGQATPMNLCERRYDQPCQVDTDCGPAGFTCTPACDDAGNPASCALCPGGTSCSLCAEQPQSHCTSDDQCPQGWTCTNPCPCGTAADALNKACFAPLSLPVGCPEIICESAGAPDGG